VAQVAELTGLLPGLAAAGWPDRMRMLVRRERPHPGAQISVFEADDGWRYQYVATDTPQGQLPFLEARHRADARVEDRIRTAKQAGLGRFPSREFAINAVWLQLALTAADLIAWTQTTLLDEALAKAEPKLPRYRLLHTPPGSSTADDGPSSRSRPVGPGPTSSSPRSLASPASDNPCWPNQPARHRPPTTKDPGEPDTRPADPHARTEDQQPTAKFATTMIIPGIAKDGG
jgi:hypothetical protein